MSKFSYFRIKVNLSLFLTKFSLLKIKLFKFFLLFKKGSCNIKIESLFEKTLIFRYAIILLFSINTFGQSFYQSSGTPENMIDKSTLKPNVGSFSSDVTAISENLNQGKTNVNIPLFDFEYYDYKIPVSINNNYPQKISKNIEGPTFYLNSRVGGDWTLSIDQFKVSRQLNGNEDENPNNGYFSSFSQSKVNNITSISNSDVINGLKGSWDPAIDVFHFSTPTVSGSFLVNLKDGTFRNLTDASFFVKYTRDSNSINSFTVTDDKGTQYLFGGDETSIEISQSKTGVTSYGVDKTNGLRLKYVVEFNNDGTLAKYTPLGDKANIYVPNYPSNFHIGVQIPTPPDTLLQQMRAPGFNINTSGYGAGVYNLGNNCYGLLTYTPGTIVELPGKTTDDDDLRRSKVNTGWYLREIKLINGKKIIFDYQNSWVAYRTYAANKIELYSSVVDYPYINRNNVLITLPSLKVYNCMPQSFSAFQFPINESYSATTNFIKSPELVRIHDEDSISDVVLSNYKGIPISPEYDRVKRPYVLSPSSYSNAPQETINAGNTEPLLIQRITYKKNNEALNINFENQSFPNDESIKNFSKLNELVINNSKKYVFTYTGGTRLSKIKYPTGATKQFYSHEIVGDVGNFALYNNVNIDSAEVTDSIVTISENNKTTEKYIYSNPRFRLPSTFTRKTFRPDITTCTTFADFTSTSPVFNSWATRSGVYFISAKKYINKDLVLLSELDDKTVYYTSNTLYMTNEQPAPSSIYQPPTYYDQKLYNIKKTTQFKKDSSNQFLKQKTTDLSYNYSKGSLEFPCVYLANIEAGPWSNTSGAIRRAYSRYYYPTAVEADTITKIDSVFFDNNKFVKTMSISYYKRYFNSLGTNIRKLELTAEHESSENLWQTKYLNVNSIEFANMDSPLFQSMRKNNICPDLVKIAYKNNNILSIDTNKYKLLNINSGIPVLDSQKIFQANSITMPNTIGISFNPVDPNNLIYDSRYKDQIFYDKYDINGRLIEYHRPNGNSMSVLWGYKGQYPIAKLDNYTYGTNTFGTSFSDIQAISVNGTESQLYTALKNLRGSYSAKITTYTYKPFGGISTVTDEKGFTTYYEYDVLNRLKEVKDKDGKILSAYKYNYKN